MFKSLLYRFSMQSHFAWQLRVERFNKYTCKISKGCWENREKL